MQSNAQASSVQEILDREAIRTLRYQFSLALDTNDWALLESLLKDQIDIDYQAFGVAASTATRTEFSGFFKQWYRRPGLVKQHLLTNMTISLHGDRASAHSELLGQYQLSDEHGTQEFIAHGYYDDEFERIDGKWLFSAIRVGVRFTTGNPEIAS